MKILRYYNETEDHLSDVKLLLIIFIKKMKLTLSQFLAEIYEDSFNAFSLQAKLK